MDVTRVAPLEAGSLVWQEGGLPPWLTVVCKATFRLLPGESKLAPDQEPLRADDESLYAPSDLVPRKARAEVTLVGHAFSPRGEATRSLVVRLVVGPVDKEIEIFGDRAWTREGVLRDGARFVRMPLSHDRAAGGPGTSNPLGVRTGPDAQPDAQGAVKLPNLQLPGGPPGSRDDRMQPVGFGPVPASFPERALRLGRDALDAPFPNDFDFTYFNAAPADQQMPMLRDGERLILQNLHRDHARLMTALPATRPRAFAERPGAPPREVGLRCDALWIDTDRAICTLTWRGQISLASRDEPGRVICALESPGERLLYEDVLALAGPPPEPRRPAPVVPDPPPAPAVIEPPAVIDLPPEEQDGPTTLALPEVAPTPGKGFVSTARIPAFVPSDALPFNGGAASTASTSPPRVVTEPFFGGAPPPEPFSRDAASSPPAKRASDPPPPPAPPPPRARARTQMLTGTSPATARGPAWLNAPVPPDLAGAPAAPRFGEPPPVSPARARESSWPAPMGRGRLEALPPVAAAVRAPSSSRDAIELVWVDPAAAPKIRRAFGDLLADLPPPTITDPDSARAERHEAVVMRVFSSGRRCDAAALEDAMAGAVGPDARFLPPVVLVAGELRFTFDELDALRARASVREAFAETGRALPEELVGAEVQRLLLARRAYPRRALLGGPRIRALLTLPGAEVACPIYLPEALATVVPMFPAFEARLLAQAHPSQDQWEAHPVALEALALGRVVPGRERR